MPEMALLAIACLLEERSIPGGVEEAGCQAARTGRGLAPLSALLTAVGLLSSEARSTMDPWPMEALPMQQFSCSRNPLRRRAEEAAEVLEPRPDWEPISRWGKGTGREWVDLASRWVRSIQRDCLDLFFPPYCLVCAGTVDLQPDATVICPSCREYLAPPSLSWCRDCGVVKPPGRTEPLSCRQCVGKDRRWDQVYPLGAYEGLRRDVVLRMKQAAAQVLAVHMGRLLGDRLRERWGPEPVPDAIIPIPKHWLRRLWRGTNSAELLAEGIGDVWKVPVRTDLLHFQRLTSKQSLLSEAARRRNLAHAFSVAPGVDLRGKRLLLVDDLMTTGATMSEASRVLRRRGAEQLDIAVVCRA